MTYKSIWQRVIEETDKKAKETLPKFKKLPISIIYEYLWSEEETEKFEELLDIACWRYVYKNK